MHFLLENMTNCLKTILQHLWQPLKLETAFYENFCIQLVVFAFCTNFQVKIKLYMVAAVGGCVVLFSSLLLAALLLHLRRRQEHKYLRQVPSYFVCHASPLLFLSQLFLVFCCYPLLVLCQQLLFIRIFFQLSVSSDTDGGAGERLIWRRDDNQVIFL